MMMMPTSASSTVSSSSSSSSSPGYNNSEAHANPSHNSGEELGRIEVENCVRAVGREPIVLMTSYCGQIYLLLIFGNSIWIFDGISILNNWIEKVKKKCQLKPADD